MSFPSSLADIFGYTPSSSQSSENSTETNDDGEQTNKTDANGNEIFESSGAITVTRNYRRQYGPSNAYQDVVNGQTYVYYSGLQTTTPTPSYIQNCDARYGSSVEDLTYEGEGYPLCCKASRGNIFYYTIPIYRKSLIWLRLAEAINRAGYPEFAFAVLKDGINQYTLPEVVEDYTTSAHLDEQGDTIWTWNRDSTRVTGFVQDTTYFHRLDYGTYGAMYYVTDSTRLQKFNSLLNFKDEIWNSTYGIHAKGTGLARYTQGNNAVLWSSADEGAIATSIAGYRDSVYYDYSKLLLAQGVNVGTASQEAIINAVENLIVDELALETAFEGNRFTDLVRIAEHKNASGYNGTDWLANKIANRGSKAATSTAAAVENFDASIYAKLQDTSHWYFALPAWTGK